MCLNYQDTFLFLDSKLVRVKSKILLTQNLNTNLNRFSINNYNIVKYKRQYS